MMVGIGIDIVEIHRIREALEGNQTLEKKVFTDEEIGYCRQRKNKNQHFGGRFAAKEAALKALGTGWSQGIHWKDVEIIDGAQGRPTLVFHGTAKEVFEKSGAQRTHLSITHSSEHAVAVVVLEAKSG
ncbi:MAG: holo-ACP synthase [Acidobacteriota bacterium]